MWGPEIKEKENNPLIGYLTLRRISFINENREVTTE
jgi:hypothetical protein